MKSGSAVIEVSALRVEREAVILESIDWRVERGEHWAILGANGSGKTSLLRALTGYLPPTAGQIRVLGETYGRFDWRELRTRIGLVSSSVHQMMEDSETALKAIVSGRYAQIGYWGEMRDEDRRAADAILRRIEARELRERPWRFLSQGERQRVLIGRALMASPRLLILDEPCAGLDPVAREHFLQFLSRLARARGAPTMVLVTHHVERSSRYSRTCWCSRRDACSRPDRAREYSLPQLCRTRSPRRYASLARAADTRFRCDRIGE